MKKRYVCYVDGKCLHNGKKNAEIGWSYLVYDASKFSCLPEHRQLKNQHPVMELRIDNFHHPVYKRTNNVAEALGMDNLLYDLFAEKILAPDHKVYVFSDSDLIRKHILGKFKVTSNDLKNIYMSIHSTFMKYQALYDQIVWDTLSLLRISGASMKGATAIGH